MKDYNRSHKIRRFLKCSCIALITIGVCLLILCQVPAFSERARELATAWGQSWQLRALDMARERWAARSFSSYYLTINVSIWNEGTGSDLFSGVEPGGLITTCRYEAEVIDEAVVTTIENTCASTTWGEPIFSIHVPETVTGLFNEIERTITEHECGPNGCICDGFIGVDVSYDRRLGYPKTVKESRKQEYLLFLNDLSLFTTWGCTLVGWGLWLPEYKVTLVPIP